MVHGSVKSLHSLLPVCVVTRWRILSRSFSVFSVLTHGLADDVAFPVVAGIS